MQNRSGTQPVTAIGPRPAGAEAGCLWCGTLLNAGASKAATYRVLRCARCGAGTTVPFPTPDALEAAYAQWYRPQVGRFAGGGDRLLRGLRGRTARWIDAACPPGPILDVGCGDGAMLDALHQRGRSAVGLERHSDRPDVRSSSLAECEEGWAGIILWHSLEHLPAPRQAFVEAAQRLAPGGFLVVAVPNFASLQAQIFGRRWLHLDLPRHLSHLTPECLRSAARGEGLEMVALSNLRGGQVVFGWLHGLVGMLPGHPDLYQAIRRRAAREHPSSAGRWATLGVAALLSPLALGAGGIEVLLNRAGTVCLVARRAAPSAGNADSLVP